MTAPVMTVDSRGRRCPLPIIDLAASARTAVAGTVITLIADDPAAGPDVAAWCRMRGHSYEGEVEHVPPDGSRSYTVRLSG